MICDDIDRNEAIEQYVLGRLQGSARDEFDQHVFECDRCFSRLQTVRALRRELASAPEALAIEPASATRRWIWKWAWAPAFAVVLVAASVTLWPRGPQPTRPEPATSSGGVPGTVTVPPNPPAPAAPGSSSLAELGRIQPPPFEPGSFRGIDDAAAARFRQGMRRYAESDYLGAIADLRAAAGLDPEAAHASFFLGMSLVLNGQMEEGIGTLRQTIALGDSPYLEEAHFYLAKALLLSHDAAGAREELERTIRLNGALESQARQLRDDVDRVSPQKR